MTTNIDQLLTKIKINGILLTHQEPNADIGVKESRSSCFLESKGILINGENNNPKKNERRSLITLIDLKTNKIKGIQIDQYFSSSNYFIKASLNWLF